MDKCQQRIVTVNVSPTFLSTDLLQPISKSRVTLPTIGYAPRQPYQITTLMLSHCRKNDQLLCPPEKGGLIQEKKLRFQCPEVRMDASHVSKFSLFPQPFNDLSVKCPTERDKGLQSLQQSLFFTTSYKETFRRHAFEPVSHSNTINDGSNADGTATLNEPLCENHTSNDRNKNLEDTKDNISDIVISDDFNDNDNGNDVQREEETIDEYLFVISMQDKETQTSYYGRLTIRNDNGLLKRGYNINPLDAIRESSQPHHCNESKRDASTQTVYPLTSLVKQDHGVQTPTLCRPFPRLPSLASPKYSGPDEPKHEAVIPKKRLCLKEHLLTTRFNARSRYNEVFGIGGIVKDLTQYRRDGKTMYFYGEHTSVFR